MTSLMCRRMLFDLTTTKIALAQNSYVSPNAYSNAHQPLLDSAIAQEIVAHDILVAIPITKICERKMQQQFRIQTLWQQTIVCVVCSICKAGSWRKWMHKYNNGKVINELTVWIGYIKHGDQWQRTVGRRWTPNTIRQSSAIGFDLKKSLRKHSKAGVVRSISIVFITGENLQSILFCRVFSALPNVSFSLKRSFSYVCFSAWTFGLDFCFFCLEILPRTKIVSEWEDLLISSSSDAHYTVGWLIQNRQLPCSHYHHGKTDF